jgi:5-methyltetrahydrofolate--homocysteine methyltransferase
MSQPPRDFEMEFLQQECGGDPVYLQIAISVITGNQKESVPLTQQAIDRGDAPTAILNQGLVAGMAVVGERFRKNEIFVPEVLIAARAMKAAMVLLRPLLTQTGAKPIGLAVMGTVKGDLHDIGKNIVGMMWEGAGMQIVELGVDVSAEKFVKAVREHRPQVLGLSAMLTTTMLNMKVTIDALKAAGLRDSVKVLVGGAPVSKKFAAEIGADGWGENASHAVTLVKQVLAVEGEAPAEAPAAVSSA